MSTNSPSLLWPPTLSTISLCGLWSAILMMLSACVLPAKKPVMSSFGESGAAEAAAMAKSSAAAAIAELASGRQTERMATALLTGFHPAVHAHPAHELVEPAGAGGRLGIHSKAVPALLEEMEFDR